MVLPPPGAPVAPQVRLSVAPRGQRGWLWAVQVMPGDKAVQPSG